MRPALLFTLVLVSCSSSNADVATAPGPIPAAKVASDYALTVLANMGAERIVFASFVDGAVAASTCTDQDVSGCTLSVCEKNPAAAKGTPVDPGKLTVSSPSMGTGVELPNVGEGFFQLVQPGNFADREQVRVSSVGSASVAAFDLEVQIPANVAPGSFGSCPFGPSGVAPCNLGDGAPLVTWSQGGDTVVIALNETVDVSPRTSLTCRFDGAANKGKVPDGVLARLPRKSPFSVRMTVVGSTVVTTGAGKKVGFAPMRWLSKAGAVVSLTF